MKSKVTQTTLQLKNNDAARYQLSTRVIKRKLSKKSKLKPKKL